MKRTCSAPGCTVTFVPAMGPFGGGGANRIYCCFLCQQRAYRVRFRERWGRSRKPRARITDPCQILSPAGRD